MILALSNDNFSTYGRLLSPDSLQSEVCTAKTHRLQHLRAQKNKVCGYRFAEHFVCLRCEAGTAVLAVSKDKAVFTYFFLDTPVCLSPQVYFAVLPFSDYCAVSFWTPKNAQAERFLDWKRLSEFPVSSTVHAVNYFGQQYLKTEKDFFFKGESHRATELIYITNGRLHCVADGVDRVLHPGEMTVFGENQWHTLYCDRGEQASFYCLTFELDDSEQLTDCVFPAPYEADETLSRLKLERENPDAVSHDLCVSALQQLLLKAVRLRQTATEEQARPSNDHRMVAQAMRFIAEHCCQSLSVGIVAKGVNISPSYLSVLFQKCLHVSPGDYIRRARLEESRALIRAGKLNVTQIAQALDYSTVYHFSRQFKEKFGVTPTQYAKSLQ